MVDAGVIFDKPTGAAIINTVKKVGREFEDISNDKFTTDPAIGEIVAIITVVVSGATYEAKEQVWNGTSFTDFTGQREWKASTIGVLEELNGNTTVSVGDIICPFFKGATDQSHQWFFVKAAQAAGVDPVTVTFDAGLNLFTVTSNFIYSTNLNPLSQALLTGSSGDLVNASSTMVFKKLGTSYNVNLLIIRPVDADRFFADGAKVLWFSTEAGISNDAATDLLESVTDSKTVVCSVYIVQLKLNGTFSIFSASGASPSSDLPYSVDLESFYDDRPYLDYVKTGKEIFLRHKNDFNTAAGNLSDIFTGTGGDVYLTKSFTAANYVLTVDSGTPVDDIVVKIGSITVDASDNLTDIKFDSNFLIPQYGKTENVLISGTTLQFVKGAYVGNT